MRGNPRFHLHLHCVHKPIFNSLSLLCLILVCVCVCVCTSLGLNFLREPWQAQTTRPDAKDQADGGYEDKLELGVLLIHWELSSDSLVWNRGPHCITSDLVTDRCSVWRTTSSRWTPESKRYMDSDTFSEHFLARNKQKAVNLITFKLMNAPAGSTKTFIVLLLS